MTKIGIFKTCRDFFATVNSSGSGTPAEPKIGALALQV